MCHVSTLNLSNLQITVDKKWKNVKLTQFFKEEMCVMPPPPTSFMLTARKCLFATTQQLHEAVWG